VLNKFTEKKTASMLATEAGRQALGAQMGILVQKQLAEIGIARKFLEVDTLKCGEIARYDKDGNSMAAAATDSNGDFISRIAGEYVEPCIFDVVVPSSVRIVDIRQKRFKVLDRMQEKIGLTLAKVEDSNFLALLEGILSVSQIADPSRLVRSNRGISKNFLLELCQKVTDRDLPAYAFLMNFKTYEKIDKLSEKEHACEDGYGVAVMPTNVANDFGMEIFAHRLVPDNTVYALSEPRFNGVIPVRMAADVIPNPVPDKPVIGFMGYENIGMVLINSDSVAKGIFTE